MAEDFYANWAFEIKTLILGCQKNVKYTNKDEECNDQRYKKTIIIS
jgi:hypothetical protein